MTHPRLKNILLGIGIPCSWQVLMASIELQVLYPSSAPPLPQSFPFSMTALVGPLLASHPALSMWGCLSKCPQKNMVRSFMSPSTSVNKIGVQPQCLIISHFAPLIQRESTYDLMWRAAFQRSPFVAHSGSKLLEVFGISMNLANSGITTSSNILFMYYLHFYELNEVYILDIFFMIKLRYFTFSIRLDQFTQFVVFHSSNLREDIIKMKAQQKMMKAVILEGPKLFKVKQIPIPKPGPGQVLIKVMAAPINPSDTIFMQNGQYSDTKKTPCTLGFEGSGLVVQNGGGLMGWGVTGKKVAFSPIQASGTYAQYAIAKADQCIPLEEQISYEQASMSLVNPLTAIGFVDIAKQLGAKTIIHTAAASSLGRMVNRYLPTEKIQVVNIVRRQEQVQLLKNQGAQFILNSSDQSFQQDLTKLIKEHNINLAFDAIGGETTGQILKLMPKNSTAYVYGCLSKQINCSVDTIDMLYNDKTLKGFFLPNWMQSKGVVKLLPTIYRLRKLLKKELTSTISKEVTIQKFEEGLKFYLENMTKGKVLIKPWMVEEDQNKNGQKQEQL